MVLRIAGLPVWAGPSDLVAAARAVVGWTDEAVGLVARLPARASALLDDVERLVGRVDRAVDDIERLAGLVGTLAGAADEVLVGARRAVADADGLVRRIGPVLTDVNEVLARADGVATGAAGLVQRADRVAAEAATVIDAAGTTAIAAHAIVADVGGVAERAGQLVAQVEGTSGAASRLLELYRPVAELGAPLARRFVEEFSETELHAAIRMIDHLPQLTEHLERDILPILATLDRVGPDVHQLLEVLQDVRVAIQGVPGFRLLRRWGEREEAPDG